MNKLPRVQYQSEILIGPKINLISSHTRCVLKWYTLYEYNLYCFSDTTDTFLGLKTDGEWSWSLSSIQFRGNISRSCNSTPSYTCVRWRFKNCGEDNNNYYYLLTLFVISISDVWMTCRMFKTYFHKQARIIIMYRLQRHSKFHWW